MERTILKTLAKAQETKGYAIEKEDAKRILEDLKNNIEELEKVKKDENTRHWRRIVTTEDGVESLLWDPSNIFHVCKTLGVETPKWYGEKYAEYVC